MNRVSLNFLTLIAVPVAWAAEDTVPTSLTTLDHVTSAHVSARSNVSVSEETEEERLADFLSSSMSYTQLILLNKNSPKSSFLLFDTVLKPLLAVLAGEVLLVEMLSTSESYIS